MRAVTLPTYTMNFSLGQIAALSNLPQMKGQYYMEGILSGSRPRLCMTGRLVFMLVLSYRRETSAGMANTALCLPSITPAKPPCANTVK